jgi:mRNA interferase RelE/StbE
VIEYQVLIADAAAKEYRALPATVKNRLQAAVDGLKADPRPRGVKKLAGHEALYRVRVGHYRIVYAIDDQQKLVYVTRIRHRRDVYR